MRFEKPRIFRKCDWVVKLKNFVIMPQLSKKKKALVLARAKKGEDCWEKFAYNSGVDSPTQKVKAAL
jgi:hypothetical protein